MFAADFTLDIVLTLPYWELKLKLLLLSQLLPLQSYLTLLGIETVQIETYKRTSNQLTLPYWELKLFPDFEQFFHEFPLTLPYWELKHVRHCTII